MDTMVWVERAYVPCTTCGRRKLVAHPCAFCAASHRRDASSLVSFARRLALGRL